MRDLSLHVLDIVQNSIKAKANTVEVDFALESSGWLTLTVKDDGVGMDPEFLSRVQDPFTTTRTTRKVGLGIPMLKANAERAGGTLSIQSEVGVGTTLTATFDLGNIDCIPMGNMCETLLTLVMMNPDKPDFVFRAFSSQAEASFDTREVRQALGGLPLNSPEIVQWMKESLEEELKPILEV